MPIAGQSSYATFAVLRTLDFFCKNVNFVSQPVFSLSLSCCLRCIKKHNVAAVLATWN